MERLTDKLNELNANGKLEYNDYSLLFDLASELETKCDELENGTLIKLPAPLGSDLWEIKYPTHKHGKETVTVLSDTLATVEKSKYPLSLSNVEMVGKYYFLSCEEAEKRLEELKG